MYVEICKTDSRGTLCGIVVSQREALLLIQSLSNQIVANSANAGRLESKCKGDATEMTIFVREK